MAERLDIVSQSNFPTNKSNTVEIVTTTKKKVTTASASDIATLVTPAISNLDIATQTNFPIQESDAQSDFIITTDGGVNNITAEAAAGLISSYIPTGGGDPHKPDFTADYSENYSDFSNFTGSGTEADPYQIWDEEMFLNARFKINNGGLSDATYFKQMRDIVWQFDGIGWGSYASDITIDYGDPDQTRSGLTYGSYDTIHFINYDGGNWTLYVHNKGFIYNFQFTLDLLGITDIQANEVNYIDGPLYASILNCNVIKNVNLKFTGDPMNCVDSNSVSLNLLEVYGSHVDGGVYNCVVDGYKSVYESYESGGGYSRIGVNGSVGIYVYSGTNNQLPVENCIVRNIYHSSKMISGGVVNNCIIDNVGPNLTTALYCYNCNNVLIKNVDAYNGTRLVYFSGGSALTYRIYNCRVENVFIHAQASGASIFYTSYGSKPSEGRNTIIIENCSLGGTITAEQGAASTNTTIYAGVRIEDPSSTYKTDWYLKNFKNDAIFYVKNGSYTYDATKHKLNYNVPVENVSGTIDNGALVYDAN